MCNDQSQSLFKGMELISPPCWNWVGSVHLNDERPAVNDFMYRTEMYLEEREKRYVNQSSSSSITTWKHLKYRKCAFDPDQAEIDRVVSTIDSIHGTFNRSLLIPYNQVYSSLYGGGSGGGDDDDVSIRLMKVFCQRQEHYFNCDLSIKDNDHSHTHEISSSFGNFLDTDEEKEEYPNENEKKNSYDSAYGSVIPIRQLSREPLLNLTQPMHIN